MKLRNITLAGIILLVLSFTISIGTAQSDNQASKATKEIDDVEPYEGPIGPEHALYGLKIAFENLDESFTFNAGKKLEKQIAHQELRIAEAKAALIKKNNNAAARALELFQEKNKETENAVSSFPGSDSGLEHAFEMIKKHQYVLENLNILHPDNPGLARAYENSLKLEQKFRGKLAEHGAKEEREEEGHVKIKAKTNGSDTEVEVSIKFKSDNVTNFTIAKEILDRFQLSTENINSLLTVENIDKVELKTELDAEAEIKNRFSEVEAEYKFPLPNVISRTEIADGIYLKLKSLTVQDILNVLEIKLEGKAKKEEIEQEGREEKQGKATIKQTSRENKEERGKKR